MLKPKIKIFSHESDIDGLGNIVLGKIAFGEIEYELFYDPQHLKEKMLQYIKNCDLYQYDQMYITDLALYDPALQMINDDEKLKNKILIFDHHKGAVDAHCDRYTFSNVIPIDKNGKKKCGTELFYEYLCENKMIEKTQVLDMFVELTRLEDTWEWTKQGTIGIMAHDLAILFNAIGKEEYVLQMIKKLTKDTNMIFHFDDIEQKIIINKKEECERSIQKAIDEMEYLIDELENRFGIVFANYEFRNEIPEYIRNIGNPEKIKYVIIVAMDKGENGQKSYRLVEDGFDVNEIAKLHGGGGHVAAAAVAITPKQKEKLLHLSQKEGLEYISKCKYE